MIIRINLTALLLLTSLICFGQELPKDKTDDHVQIEGSNIFMIPPASFEASSNFKGFQDPDDQFSMIMTMEMPGAYTVISESFNSEMLKAQGMELISKKEISIADHDGILIELNQAANGMVFSKHILIYGNEKSTTMINGIYLKESLALGERIKESVLTTYVDAELNANPRDALSYTIDEEVGSLQLITVTGNSMAFNRDLKTPTESADQATLIVDKSYAKVDIENKKLFCISRLKKYPDDHSVISEMGITEIELDGLKGFELFAINNVKPNKEMYQVILFDDDGGYYLLLGNYVTKSETAIADIKSIVKTFSRK